MISEQELRLIARARLKDAQVLLRAKRFDGAYYLGGYAVEIGLKAPNLSYAEVDRFPGRLVGVPGSSVFEDPRS